MNQRPETPHPPYDDFRSALGEHPDGHAAVDDLQRTLNTDSPRAADVHASVERVGAFPALQAHVATWLEAPRTQNWLKILSDAGL